MVDCRQLLPYRIMEGLLVIRPELLNRRLPSREGLIFYGHLFDLDVPEGVVVFNFVRSRRQQVRAKG